ncbi:hypothetical protein [Luteimonas salinilitoris]|uniref:DUF4352 domain-containing protein n=1 Tax=Luteimonas salinilitoris TaxID=3237697 RepID=A0ABV4HZ17_9GAMM
MTTRLTLSLLTLCLVAACKQQPSPDTAAAQSPADTSGAAAEATTPPNPTVAPERTTPPAAAAPIATQTGPKGSQWDLSKVAVTGNVLTVQFNVRTGDENLWNPSFPLSDVSVLDDATSQRYSPLQDSSGKPMAAPLNTINDKMLKLDIKKNSNGVIWLKFPAPPTTSQTVSINIPEVAPFDGVAIQR